MNAIADVQVSVPPVAANAGDVIGVDLAKNVFQLCIADSAWRVLETRRLSRHQFESFFLDRAVALVVMEACGSAHHWARWLNRLGIEVLLLPPAYVRAYVRRNKTDAADAAALLQAARDSDIKPVRVKSVEQQALQGLHRTRSLWKANRTQRINTLRGFCREFGIAIAQGSRLGVEQIARVLAEPHSAVPELLRPTANLLVEEIRLLEARMAQLERELTSLVRHSAACTTLLSIPGIGLLTSTAMVRRHLGRGHALQGCAPFRELVWPDAQRTLLRQLTPARAHQQAGRHLLAHAAHPRRQKRAQGRRRRHRTRQTTRRTQGLGAGRAEPYQSQQGRLRTGQQAGQDRLRLLA